MVAITGKCVIIDEFGNGIHDLMAAKLMKAVSQNIKGQLIITTHNTLIMDHSNIKPDALYFIFNGLEGKKVKCVTDVEERLHPNYNYMRMGCLRMQILTLVSLLNCMVDKL